MESTQGWTAGARCAANFLASLPTGIDTLNRKDYRSLMVETGGTMMARGYLYRIVGKSLGAGIYQVSLKLVNSARRPGRARSGSMSRK